MLSSLRFSVFCVLLGGFLCQAQAEPIPIIAKTAALRHGLVRPWVAQAEVDRSRDRVNHVLLYQPPPDFELAALEAAADPAADPADPNAQDPQQSAIAKAWANAPPDVLYILTERGNLQAMDAQTGRTLWINRVGNPAYPNEKPAANSKGLAILNGTRLYYVRRDTGQIVWEVAAESAVLAGPAMDEQWIFLPLLNGKVQAFNIEDPKITWFFQSTGQLHVAPIVTDASVAWATSRGYLYLSSARDRPAVTMRFEARREITAQPSYWPPYIYLASRDGFVYCVHERSGDTPWRFSAGDSITERPIPLEDDLFVIPEEHGMYCLDNQTGKEKWRASYVKQFIAASPTRVYAVDELRRLLVLDRKSGAQLDSMDVGGNDLWVPNLWSDRIYLGTKQGLIQCMHEAGLPQRQIHIRPSLLPGDKEPDPNG